MRHAKKIALVIPTYNEEENIKALLTEVLSQQRKITPYKLDILISDSNSPDQTRRIAQETARESRGRNIIVINSKERGVGTGLRAGFDYALRHGYPIIMQMDADFSHDPNDIPRLLENLTDNTAIVIGSRYIQGGKIKTWSLDRRILSASANLFIRFLSGLEHIHEFTTNFRAFRTEIYANLQKELHSYKDNTFLVAFLLQAHKAGYPIKEIPIVFADRVAGESKIDVWAYTPNLLYYLIKERVNTAKGYFGGKRSALKS